ncbi:MAG: deoxyribonuclease IV [Gaiellales bacterium]
MAAYASHVLIGGHVSSAGGIQTAVDRAVAIGADALQLFTQSPRMWRPTAHDPVNLAEFRRCRSEAGIGYVLCHALYLINLASPDPELHAKSVKALLATLDVARELEGDVVFHVGSHQGAGFAAGLERVVPAIAEALEHTGDGTWLLLESSAGAGGTIGRSLEELVAIVERLDRHPRLGLCLDTCHLYVSGIDVASRPAVDELLAGVERGVGLDRLRAIHLNDAAAPLGSNRDRHANIGEGTIGDGLAVMLGHPLLQGTPFLLETPGPEGHGPDAAQIEAARALWRRARRGRGATAAARRKPGPA